MIELAMPVTTGEWYAFCTAIVLMLVALPLIILPRRFMGLLGLSAEHSTVNGLSEVRGPFGGYLFGTGLAAILLAQPLVYLALGIGFVFMVVGRLLSFVLDRSFNLHCIVLTVVEATAAVFMCGYGLQIFP